MRLVCVRQEALYRGYRIEGTKEGECTILRVIPTRPDLSSLAYSRFRSFPRGTWRKAAEVVCDYVDQALRDQTSLSHTRSADRSPKESAELSHTRTAGRLPKESAKENAARFELGIGAEDPTPSSASSPAGVLPRTRGH
jgi:hypothetical protein